MGLDFLIDDLVIRDALVDLEMRSSKCDFCRLLLHTWKRYRNEKSTTAGFRKVGSRLTIDEHSRTVPVLSICRIPAQDPSSEASLPEIQIGFPQLPEIGSHTHFEVQRQWLEDCDKNHHQCRPDQENVNAWRPTRLIDVGRERNSATVRLVDTAVEAFDQSEKLKYIALSHPWGDRKIHKHYCTTRNNLDRHRIQLVVDDLPDTFKHAVKVTRELSVRYLWIDSLCIIQGENGDFENEAEHMETVFSTAYCVISASCATGTSDGFLLERLAREVVRFETGREDPFYICEAIDDFQHDVIEGGLSKRGWVLQERALARRSIYFTTKQTYWECGDGIRCETLTKMSNNQAAFLGDPNFPRVAMEHTKGGKIRLYESLYKQYSKLAFSKITDRPIAIAGLEQRLIRAFGTNGGFGIFGGYLGRSLLWQRAPNVQSMTRIDFGQKRVPSWSWMAYEDEIMFMDLPFNGVEWEKSEICSPWDSNTNADVWLSTRRSSNTHLEVIARDFRVPPGNQQTGQLIFDGGYHPEGRTLKCITIGRRKDVVGSSAQMHYVLLISQKSEGDVNLYERAGVGFMPKNWITFCGLNSTARVV